MQNRSEYAFGSKGLATGKKNALLFRVVVGGPLEHVTYYGFGSQGSPKPCTMVIPNANEATICNA